MKKRILKIFLTWKEQATHMFYSCRLSNLAYKSHIVSAKGRGYSPGASGHAEWGSWASIKLICVCVCVCVYHVCIYMCIYIGR